MKASLRSPVAWAALALVAAAAGGIVTDAVSPASPRRPRSVGAITPGGVWACPVASFGKLGGFVSVANGSVEKSAVRVRFVRPPLPPQEFGLTLAPGHAATLKVPPGTAGAGAIVQWAGGDVVASRSAALVTPQGKTVATGASCSRTGETVLAVTGLRTLNGDSRVVLLNPSSAEALVDVSFLVAGDEQTPESLTSRVVPARGRLEIRVGDFAFDKPDIAAVVRVTTGAVVADGVLISQQGAHIVPAGPPQRAAAAAAETPFGAKLDVVSLGDEPTTAVATTILTRSQETTANFPAALDPLGPSAVGYDARGPLAVALSVREGSPFVGSVAWSLKPRGAGDTAAAPLLPAARRWLAVTQSPIGSPAARLVIANPGVEPVRLRARFLTPEGQVASGELADVRIPAGRVVAFPIRSVGSAIGVEVVAVDGLVVTAIVVSGGSGDAAFSYALTGVPAQLAKPVVVDAEVVGQFVEHGVADDAREVGRGACLALDGSPVDRDAVGEHARVPAVSLGQRDALIQTEETRLVRLVLHDDLDVGERRREVRRQSVEGVGHEVLEIAAPRRRRSDERGPGLSTFFPRDGRFSLHVCLPAC